ncbi:MAG: hypothetical protein ABW185_25465 [Sedimenticola sp.]
MSKRIRNSYDVSFKLKVIDYAETHNNCQAERQFGVTEKMVRDWRAKKAKLMNSGKTLKKVRIGVSPYEQLEASLNEWVLEQRQKGHIVTRSTIRLLALQKAKDPQYQIDVDKFKASAGWCTRFMRRHGLAMRQRTHIAQKLPKDLDDKLENFHKFVINQRKSHMYDIPSIGNMDETPMYFDMPGNSTVHIKGDKTVAVRTSGAEKSHFTVVLSCLADGTKLKPMVIFKRKTMPKEKLPAGVVVEVNPKGWVNETVCNIWLEKIWDKRPGALLKRKALLVWDMFRAHLVESVKKTLQRLNTHQAVIPGGTTSILQPLDVCLNKPFKVNMRKEWHAWMIEGPTELTAAGNLKKPTIPLVCGWVVKAWDAIPSDMVARSFKKCGISNSMDGSEDDQLYSDLIANGTSDTADGDSDPEDTPDSDDIYDDVLTNDQFVELFGTSDDEEDFEGFGPDDI